MLYNDLEPEGWEYLGSNEKVDFYVVNRLSGNDSLTIKFGNGRSDYASAPIYQPEILESVQKKKLGDDLFDCLVAYDKKFDTLLSYALPENATVTDLLVGIAKRELDKRA